MRMGSIRMMSVAACVMLAMATGRAFGEEKKEKGEENEVKVKLTEVPEAVKARLTREAKGAAMPDEVDKETDDGKVIYEVDVKINGKDYEIKAASDGTLICKKLDEGDEKDEKDEKKEK